MMRYLSICSGIEAASVAWHPLGWKPVGFSEIEPFPSAVLAHHWPDVPNLGDMTKHHDWPNTLRPDLVVGGTPCQAFSVAGLRKGLEDARGNLTLVFLGILAQFRPRWVVWENVPGVLSDRTGAFGAFLGGLGQLGYGFAYRVLDAQYFGLAQRRRRVFVVGYLGDWRRAAAVLFEPESLRGDPAPSREAGQGSAPSIAGCLGGSSQSGGFRTTDLDGTGAFIPEIANCMQTTCDDYSRADGFNMDSDCTGPITAGISKGMRGTEGIDSNWMVAHTLRAEHDASEDGTGRGTPLVPVAFSCKDHGADASDISPTLRSMNHDGSHANGGGQVAVAFSEGYFRCGSGHAPASDGVTNTLQCNTGDQRISVATTMAVRRLTPTECERLQGFPDGHTLIPWRGKLSDQCPDGPRYKALGNSMAVPVMRWIGQRIQTISEL